MIVEFPWNLSKSTQGDDTITTKAASLNRDFNNSNIPINENIESCPDCNSTNLVYDSQKAEVVCARCGLVLDENLIDKGPEWRAYDAHQHQKRARTGAPLVYAIADKGLPTDIAPKNKDVNGRLVPERNRAQMHRLRKWNRRLRVSSAAERNLAIALSDMDRLSSRLGVPRSVREDAALIYRNAAKNNLIRGRSIESMVATVVYTACRRCNIPRTLDEIAESSKISKKLIGKNYRFLSRKLGIKLPPTSPSDYVPRFATNLSLSGKVQAKAIEIIQKSVDAGLNTGKGPSGIAAAALYIGSILIGERKTQREIAEVTGVTEVTIRNRYKELSENIDLGVAL